MKNPIEIHEQELDEGGIQMVQMGLTVLQSAELPPHRDDHYILIVQRQGVLALDLDFKKLEMKGPSLCYILPGQVHAYHKSKRSQGWFVFIDGKYVNNHYREILTTFSISSPCTSLKADQSIYPLLEILERQLRADERKLKQAIVFSLVDALMGIIAAKVLYNQLPSNLVGSRKQALVTNFKQLVGAQFQKTKQVKQYASMLHISPLYLNETVKELTGFPASYWIQQAIVLEAKRLLRFSALDITHIAYELGFEDPVYFSRFFKKHASVTASAFRKDKP